MKLSIAKKSLSLPQRMAEPYIDTRILAYLQEIPQTAKILDIATGQGYLLKLLSEHGYTNLYSADLNAANFRLDPQKFHFQTVNANIPLPYKAQNFDLIISSETIEHIENPRQFLREIYRILKPGGTFILTTPSVESIISRLYFFFTSILAFHTLNDYKLSGHISILPSWLILRFTKDIGFKHRGTTYNCCYLPILKVRLTHPIFLTRFWGWVAIFKFVKPT
jgi:2-polyprenyl-3-methyl-5-hydroxy-6-metoxy-1,4-benzoquinol methylase